MSNEQTGEYIECVKLTNCKFICWLLRFSLLFTTKMFSINVHKTFYSTIFMLIQHRTPQTIFFFSSSSWIRFPTLCKSLNSYISTRPAPTTDICNAIFSICMRSVSNEAAAGCTVSFSPCARRFMNDAINDVISSSLTWTILILLRCPLFIHKPPFQRLTFVMFI